MTDVFPAGRTETLLAAEFPALGRSVPWRPLAHVPTPVEPCTAIEGWLGRGGVFQKRDDIVSPHFGGNKIRRFEYLLADAERRGARHLITAGGLASTQVMAAVLFGRAAGFEVTAALFDQPVTSFARSSMLTSAAGGGHLVYGGSYVATALRGIAAYRAAEKPYLILPGASTAMANLGYVDAALELAEQVRRGEMPRPDIIVVPAGSGGTLAGLTVGLSLLGWPTVVVGVRITELFACNRVTIRVLIDSTARYLKKHAGREVRLAAPRFGLYHGAIGRGYGYSTPEAISAVPVMERLTGTPGEITYSGKALAGLRVIARENPGKTVLFWHTLPTTRPELPAVTAAGLPRAFARFFEGEVVV